ncbi:hypothetical protein XA68_17085 [Ophiocordyceps unilateralis]|uniref:Phospholipid-transporting ATPase n=1 Tax=Ophiocordyceps unilateralis TaxID=268505 RepID=A0A2A9P527_OPHUN|nr:hypothetical protein XA68_17085 [Ophiocordyceps unilateralis]
MPLSRGQFCVVDASSLESGSLSRGGGQRARLVPYGSSHHLFTDTEPEWLVSTAAAMKLPDRDTVVPVPNSGEPTYVTNLSLTTRLRLRANLLARDLGWNFALPPPGKGRRIPLLAGEEDLLDERTGLPYIDNFVRSTRHTIGSFFPQQLYFQFSRLNNCYFLFLVSLNFMPGSKPTDKWHLLGPLLLYVGLSMAKEALGDYRRHRLDKRENESVTFVLARAANDEETEDWIAIKWRYVRVGDVVRLRRDDAVPADMLVLCAKGPNGVAYIDTMALDGETNLKIKHPPEPLAKRCTTVADIRAAAALITSEDPNPDLYNYDGMLTVDGKTLPLTQNNVVYRGSTLRNTNEAIGLVFNSGEECKIRVSAHLDVRAKKPALHAVVDGVIIIQLFVVYVLAIILITSHMAWRRGVEANLWYLAHASMPMHLICIGHLTMSATLIPLSLYISMELLKVMQLYMMHDVEMYDPVSNTPMVSNTIDALADLGQVTHVFSDKTGTMTENVMRFRKMTVGGVACLHDMNEPKVEDKADDGGLEMKTEALLTYIRRHPDTAFSRKARHLLLCIALCHTCLPERMDDGRIAFLAASPDELALVEAARDLGLLLIDRSAQAMTLRMGDDSVETYQVLDVIEFSSGRKRMSVVVLMPDGKIEVVCKGADTVIMERLALREVAERKAKQMGQRNSERKTMELERERRKTLELTPSPDWSRRATLEPSRERRRTFELGRMSSRDDRRRRPTTVDETLASDEEAVLGRCLHHVDDFSAEGLRTLVYASRVMGQERYEA